MQDIFTIQPDYTKNSIEQRLSIAIRNDGFSFVIHNLGNDSISALQYKNISSELSNETYSKELQDFLTQDILNQTFNSIQIVYTTPKVTILPAAIFNQEDLKLLYSYNQKLEQNEVLYTYKVKNSESYLVYSIPDFIISICNSVFTQKIEYFPQAASFIESSILHNKLAQNKTMFISLESSFFDVVLLDGQKIILYNTFTFSNVNDYIYYVMNIFEQLHLHPLHTNIVLSGKISKASTYFDSTLMFVKNVSTIEPFSSQKELFNYPFDKISFPLFSNLCNLSLCE